MHLYINIYRKSTLIFIAWYCTWKLSILQSKSLHFVSQLVFIQITGCDVPYSKWYSFYVIKKVYFWNVLIYISHFLFTYYMCETIDIRVLLWLTPAGTSTGFEPRNFIPRLPGCNSGCYHSPTDKVKLVMIKDFQYFLCTIVKCSSFRYMFRLRPAFDSFALVMHLTLSTLMISFIMIYYVIGNHILVLISLCNSGGTQFKLFNWSR